MNQVVTTLIHLMQDHQDIQTLAKQNFKVNSELEKEA